MTNDKEPKAKNHGGYRYFQLRIDLEPISPGLKVVADIPFLIKFLTVNQFVSQAVLETILYDFKFEDRGKDIRLSQKIG